MGPIWLGSLKHHPFAIWKIMFQSTKPMTLGVQNVQDFFKGVDSNGSNGDVFGETWGYFGSKLCNNCFHPKINHGMCRSSSPPEFLLGEILIFWDPEPKESWWVFWHPVCDLRWVFIPKKGTISNGNFIFQPLIFSRYVSFWGCICLFWREMIVEFFWVSIFWCHFLKSGGACNKTWSLSSYISPKQNFLDLFVLWTRKIAGKQSCKGSLVGESSRNSLTFWEFKRII